MCGQFAKKRDHFELHWYLLVIFMFFAGQLFTEDLAPKARRVYLDDMQNLHKECDCSSWPYSNVHKSKGAFEQF